MSKYKMIAFDMDGTLLNSQKKVRKETLDAINKAFDGGKEVILCTGRALAELEEYIELIPRMRYMVMTSGAIVYDIKEKKDIYANEISVEIMDKILNYIKDKDIMPQMITKESIVILRTIIDRTTAINTYSGVSFSAKSLVSVTIADIPLIKHCLPAILRICVMASIVLSADVDSSKNTAIIVPVSELNAL